MGVAGEGRRGPRMRPIAVDAEATPHVPRRAVSQLSRRARPRGTAREPDIRRGGGLFTLYAHLDDTRAPPSGNVGASVQAGDPSGLIGITGITTGPHLHFVIHFGDEPIDPSGLPPHF